MEVKLRPLAVVSNKRSDPSDDFWGDTVSEITLLPHMPDEVFLNIGSFSHLEIIYYFDKVNPGDIRFSGFPRGNKAYPEMGIFAQRKKDRPNQLGLCTVELLEHKGRSIKVKYLDAIDGTPVLDIKPVFKEFGLNSEIKQPSWVADLMKDYWKNTDER